MNNLMIYTFSRNDFLIDFFQLFCKNRRLVVSLGNDTLF